VHDSLGDQEQQRVEVHGNGRRTIHLHVQVVGETPGSRAEHEHVTEFCAFVQDRTYLL